MVYIFGGIVLMYISLWEKGGNFMRKVLEGLYLLSLVVIVLMILSSVLYGMVLFFAWLSGSLSFGYGVTFMLLLFLFGVLIGKNDNRF